MINYIINHINASLLCFLFTAVCLLLSFKAHSLIRKQIQKLPHLSFSEVGGIMFATISLIYSLLLAFAIVAVWEDYEEINKKVIEEAAKLSEVRETASKLPEPMYQNIKANLLNYVQTEIKNEWYQLGHKPGHNPYMHRLRTYLRHSDNLTAKQATVAAAIYDELTDIVTIRNVRAVNTRSHVPTLVWVILIVGSLSVMGFSFLFTMEPEWMNKLLSGVLTCLIAMCIFLMFMLDHPLCGSSAVSPTPLIHFAQGL